jgi:hypothetical protein
MDILYHYCSTASFHAIIQSHALWLSSLSLSNDTMEGKLVASTIARLAKRDSVDQDSVRRIQDTIGFLEKVLDGLGFCLSEDGDLLSQWRGFAADATGVSIGFSTEYLNWLSEAIKSHDRSGFTLKKVEYEPSVHESCIDPVYLQIKGSIAAGAFKTLGRRSLLFDSRTDEEIERDDASIRSAHSKLFGDTLALLPELFRLKAHAFREEREWRLLSYLVKGGEDNCSHRIVHDRIIPYRKIELVESERHPVAEVILGPKHGTPTKIVEDFLKLKGYGLVKVRRSEASYR